MHFRSSSYPSQTAAAKAKPRYIYSVLYHMVRVSEGKSDSY